MSRLWSVDLANWILHDAYFSAEMQLYVEENEWVCVQSVESHSEDVVNYALNSHWSIKAFNICRRQIKFGVYSSPKNEIQNETHQLLCFQTIWLWQNLSCFS